MSGEGLLAACCDDGLLGRAEERGDVLAYLEQRRDNAVLMAQRCPEFAADARERERQLGVMIDEIREGLHLGASIARAALTRWATPSAAIPPIEQEAKHGSEVEA